jgi:hypothetical protein
MSEFLAQVPDNRDLASAVNLQRRMRRVAAGCGRSCGSGSGHTAPRRASRLGVQSLFGPRGPRDAGRPPAAVDFKVGPSFQAVKPGNLQLDGMNKGMEADGGVTGAGRPQDALLTMMSHRAARKNTRIGLPRCAGGGSPPRSPTHLASSFTGTGDAAYPGAGIGPDSRYRVAPAAGTECAASDITSATAVVAALLKTHRPRAAPCARPSARRARTAYPEAVMPSDDEPPAPSLLDEASESTLHRSPEKQRWRGGDACQE